MSAQSQKLLRGVRTTACCLIIGGVSLFDTLLIVRHAEVLRATEENPVGRLLLTLGNGDVSLFVACKLLGTAGVLATLYWLAANYWMIAQPVIRCVTVFQCWLLWYLCSADSVIGYPHRTKFYLALVIVAICLLPFVRERLSGRLILGHLPSAVAQLILQRRTNLRE